MAVAEDKINICVYLAMDGGKKIKLIKIKLKVLYGFKERLKVIIRNDASQNNGKIERNLLTMDRMLMNEIAIYECQYHILLRDFDEKNSF